MTTRERGAEGEALALRYLQAQGLRLLHQNYGTRRGELDLVMRDGEELVFVEVRLRRDTRFGGSLGSITSVKQRRLRQAAEHYRLTHPRDQVRRCRFDVVAIEGTGEDAEFQWLRAAF